MVSIPMAAGRPSLGVSSVYCLEETSDRERPAWIRAMHPLIADNLHQIRHLCEEFGVVRLDVFGSIDTSGFDPGRSDVDFLVTYPDGYDHGP